MKTVGAGSGACAEEDDADGDADGDADADGDRDGDCDADEEGDGDGDWACGAEPPHAATRNVTSTVLPKKRLSFRMRDEEYLKKVTLGYGLRGASVSLMRSFFVPSLFACAVVGCNAITGVGDLARSDSACGGGDAGIDGGGIIPGCTGGIL